MNIIKSSSIVSEMILHGAYMQMKRHSDNVICKWAQQQNGRRYIYVYQCHLIELFTETVFCIIIRWFIIDSTNGRHFECPRGKKNKRKTQKNLQNPKNSMKNNYSNNSQWLVSIIERVTWFTCQPITDRKRGGATNWPIVLAKRKSKPRK